MFCVPIYKPPGLPPNAHHPVGSSPACTSLFSASGSAARNSGLHRVLYSNRRPCSQKRLSCCQTTGLSTYKELVTQKFNARTEYDKNNNHHPKVAAELVARAKLQQGWDVLDLACGTGLVTYLAAADVGPNGSVEAMDLSPGMIRQAKDKLHLSQGTNICFTVGDVEKATFQDNSFDAILCASSVPYLDMQIIADKVHTWLKPGRLFAYNTPEAPYTPLLPLMHQLLQEQRLNISRQPFAQIPSEESNMNILQAAGFENIKVEKAREFLLGKPLPLDVYVEKGWEIMAEGFRPFFPTLSTLSKSAGVAVKEEFFAKGIALGKSMMNADQMVEDKHSNMFVMSVASKP